MRTILCALAAISVTACVSTPKYDSQLQPWVGKTQGELFGEWGAPTDVATNEQGATVLLYHRERTFTKGGMTINMGGSFPGGNQPVTAKDGGKTIIYYCDTHFVLDASDKIASYSYDGNDCK